VGHALAVLAPLAPTPNPSRWREGNQKRNGPRDVGHTAQCGMKAVREKDTHQRVTPPD